MPETSINENLVASVTRALFYDEANVYPMVIQSAWDALTETEKQVYRNKAVQWLTDLKKNSPKTYEFVENNYATVTYR